MKVALVHDWLVSYGGAERVHEALIELYPEADIFTSIVDRNKISGKIASCKIITSFLQKIPFSTKIYKTLLPFMPIAFEQFDFTGYDLVISSSTLHWVSPLETALRQIRADQRYQPERQRSCPVRRP